MSQPSRSATTDRLAFEGGILPTKNRAALLRNKTTILDALDAVGITTLSANFQGLPFGSYIEKIDVLGPDGSCTLPAARIRYASPGRRSRFRHVKTCIHNAIASMLDEMCGDAWESAIGADGTLRIDVASRAIVLSGRGHAQPFHRVY